MINMSQTSLIAPITMLPARKEILFLKTLKQIQFSGQLLFTSSKEEQWVFYLQQGHIIAVTGGNHSVRRWQRHLTAHCPQILSNPSLLQHDLAGFNAGGFNICWEYHLLCLWVAQRKIAPKQAEKIIRDIVAEVLFGIAQALRVVYQIQEDRSLSSLSSPLVLIDVDEALGEFQQVWQVWRNAKIGDYSPNQAPVIKQREELRKRTSEVLYQILNRLLDGQHTMRDLAVLMKQDVVQVIRSLMPYIQMGLVELINIPDLPAPVDPAFPKKPIAIAAATGAVIACVDDSPLVCHTMETLLTAAGYRFVGVEDGLRSFAVLLARKPDVIFLDLVMPNTNGYEICAKLRKLPNFRNTPIVILTGNDGIVDRVRARLVGASDFLSKPIDAGKVLNAIRKHLQQGAISN